MTGKIKSIILLLLISSTAFAQLGLQVEALPPKDVPLGYNRDTLVSWVKDRLVGGGGIVDTASITYTGNREALGRFFNGIKVGLDKGLIISNGKVEQAEAPNNVGAQTHQFNAWDPEVSHGDPDLLKMYNDLFGAMGGKDTGIIWTGDAAVLEFKFQPFGDQVLLDYVFASEEYQYEKPDLDVDLTGFPNNTPPQIMDLFGISVEKPSHQFHNRAYLRKGDDPNESEMSRWVHVASINQNKNSSYYQHNPDPEPMVGPIGTQFDGVTKTTGDRGPLKIERSEVIPCSNYKVKIAIEDFYFTIDNPELEGFTVNSAVLLGEKSLISVVQQNNILYHNYSVEYYNSEPALEGKLVENCNHIVATFTLEDSMKVDYGIPYKIATNDLSPYVEVSYEDGTVITNDSVMILAGELEKVIHIRAVNISNDEPASYTYPKHKCDVENGWTPGFSGKIEFLLMENKPITLSENPKIYEAFCKETIELTVTDIVNDGIDPLIYNWNGSLYDEDTIMYKVEASPDIVNILVRDHCDNSADAVVQINNKPPVLEDILDAFLCGPGQSVDVPVLVVEPDYPDYSIEHVRWYKVTPYTDLGQADGNEVTVMYDVGVGDGIWTCGFEITDVCGGKQTGTFNVNQSELSLGDDIWICKGETREIIANAAAHWFSWFDVNDPSVELSNTNALTVTPDITTTYGLTILDLCNEEQTAYITVNVDLFEPQITIDPASAEICPGETITLSANPAVEWNWSPGNETTQSIVLNPMDPNVYTFTLTASSEYCFDKVTSASFEVFPTPVAEFTIDPDEDGCTGETIEFTYGASVTNETFKWNFDGSSDTVTTANPTHVYSQAGTYNVYLHVDKYICENDTTVELLINPRPSPDFNADIINGCAPVTVNFEDLSTDVQPQATYEWNFGDGNISNITGSTSHTFTDQGLFNVSLSINNTERCGETAVKTNYVQINPNPLGGFDPDPPITTMDNPTIVFINTTLSDSAVVSYEWDFGDNSSLNYEENPTHVYSAAGEYNVILIVETVNGCYDTVTGKVALTEEAVLFIPNAFTPNGDGVNDKFEIKGTPIADYNMYIYDRWGNQIWSTHNFETHWDGTDKAGNPVSTGSYVYHIVGTDYLKQQVSYQGTVTVIR